MSMSDARIQIFCGDGHGKSAAAIGRGIAAACEGRSVFVVRFLKGKASMDLDFVRRLEPEVKLFSFDKSERTYSELNEEEKQEEALHIRNGLNYARKVAATGECDLLILDEILDVINMGILSAEDVTALFAEAGDSIQLILTGSGACRGLWPYADSVVMLTEEKPQQA